MAHEIEKNDRVGSVGTKGWHDLGTVIEPGLSAVDAGQRMGLFWQVGRWLLEAIGPNGQRLPVRDHVATVREDNGEANILGVVGRTYQICQNQELAEFMDALSQTGKVSIETVGSIQGGRRVWWLARGESFNIGGADQVFPYILGSNAHDGTSTIRLTPTTVRAICSNTLHMIIPRAGEEESIRHDSAAYSVQHSGDLKSKLAQARSAIRHYEEVRRRNWEIYERLADTKVSQEQVLALFSRSYASHFALPTDEELRAAERRERRLAERRKARLNKAADQFLARYRREKEAIGVTDDNAWMAFNAVSGWLQHDRPSRIKNLERREEKRVESRLFGASATYTSQAFRDAHQLALSV